MTGYAQLMIKRVLSVMFGYGLTEDLGWGHEIITRVMRAAESTAASAKSTYSLYQVVSGLGYALVIIFFFIAITDAAINGKLTFEYFVKNSIRSILACFLIGNGFDILIWFFKVSELLSSKMEELLGLISAEGTDIKYISDSISAYVGSQNFTTAIGIMFIAIIPCLLSFVVDIVVRATLIVIALELVIRAVLAPIALADTYGDSMRPHAVVYLKNFAATCIQYACIVGIVMAFSALNTIVLTRDPTMADTMAKVEQYSSLTGDAEAVGTIVDSTQIIASANLETGDMDEEDEEVAKYTEEEIEAYKESLTSTVEERTMATKAATEDLAPIGKELFSSIFSMSRMIGFMGLMLALVLTIAKSRDVARLIVGL